jgi:hypothetical protein
MESIPAGAADDSGDGEEPEERRPPVHYSTGRLTRRQAEVVNRWRARLAEDRPLPGEERASMAARLILGADDRPRASCSDCIAAAVTEWLAAGPEPMALARYADASWQAQRSAAAVSRDAAAAPVYPPVSWYLPGELAAALEELRARAQQAAAQARSEVAAEAPRRYPDPGQAADRRRWYLDELRRQDIPLRGAQVPRGVPARLAIDAWARRGADQVCAAAAGYAAQWHEQPHRARRDMHTLQR